MHKIRGVSKLAVLLLGLGILGAPLVASAMDCTFDFAKRRQNGPCSVPEPASPIPMGIAGGVLVAAFAGKLLRAKRQAL